MPPPKLNQNEMLFERLAENLDSTSKLTHALLAEIRESEIDFATLRAELSSLRDNVRNISSIISEGNGSGLITKMALLEQRVDGISKCIDSSKDHHEDHEQDHKDLESNIKDIVNRLSKVEEFIKEQIDERKQKDKDLRASIIREQDFSVEVKKGKEKLKEERMKITMQIAGVIAIASITFFSTTLTKGCTYIPGNVQTPTTSSSR